MKSVYLKEVTGFFSTIIGYIVIISYLLINSLFLWVFDSGFNILNSEFSQLTSLFILSPWIFLFLVPSICMKMFSEEINSGTIEILLTQPLRERDIVLGKFFASVTLVVLSLAPSLIYFFSVFKLGNPIGNMDIGATIGSYIGLIFLSGIYVSIGLFASSLTQNQIIAFLLSVFLCFFMYTGFDSIDEIILNSSILFAKIGINNHYISISRGVLDSRDIIYFISTIIFFLFLTIKSLEKR